MVGKLQKCTKSVQKLLSHALPLRSFVLETVLSQPLGRLTSSKLEVVSLGMAEADACVMVAVLCLRGMLYVILAIKFCNSTSLAETLSPYPLGHFSLSAAAAI